MYLSFYNLKRKPFQVNTDPSFLMLGEKHKEAFTTLRKGILENEAFLLLTGDVGTGKTTMVNGLASSLGAEYIIARVSDPGMEPVDLLYHISDLLGMEQAFVSRDSFLSPLEQFIDTAHVEGKKILLIFDESQQMSQDVLGEVCLLSAIKENDNQVLTIFLVGQNELAEILKDNRHPELKQRISCSLEPLNLQETGELIKHRLKVAGTTKKIFTQSAIRAVYDRTKGFPRRINILCDNCMIFGYLKGEKIIQAEVVNAAAENFAIPVFNTRPAFQDTLVSEREVVAETLPENTPEQPGSRGGEHRSGKVLIMTAAVLGVVGMSYVYTSRKDVSPFGKAEKEKEEVVEDISEHNESAANNEHESLRDSIEVKKHLKNDNVQPYTEVSLMEPEWGYSEQEEETVGQDDDESPEVETAMVRGPVDKSEPLPVEDEIEEQGVPPADIFSNMDKYLSGKKTKEKKAVITVPPQPASEPVDSGKVIDWVLKKRSQSK